MALTACNEYYQEIIWTEPVVDDNVQSGDVTTKVKVKILPSLYDQTYNIGTRGTGPLDDWKLDREKWMSTSFGVYALRTKGKKDEKFTTDFTKKENRLLWGEPLKLTREGDVYFQGSGEGEAAEYFFPEQQSNRYKFFLLHDDGAMTQEPEVSQDKITAKLRIDGTQDIMHSFAMHSTKDMQAFHNALAGLGESEAVKLFTENPEAYMYSGLAGSLGLQPKFELNHLLTRFNIFVLGGSQNVTETNNGFLQSIIDGITIESPTDLTLTLADNAWDNNNNTYNEAVAKKKLMTIDQGSLKPVPAQLINRPIRNNTESHNYDQKTDFDLFWQDVLNSGLYSEDDIVHHVYTKNPEVKDTLCQTIMLPPGERYKIDIKGKFLVCRRDEEGKMRYTNGCYASPLTDEKSFYEIMLPPDENGNPVPFEPGKTYSVTIYVYGRSQIDLKVALESTWQNGGNINIDGNGN